MNHPHTRDRRVDELYRYSAREGADRLSKIHTVETPPFVLEHREIMSLHHSYHREFILRRAAPKDLR